MQQRTIHRQRFFLLIVLGAFCMPVPASDEQPLFPEVPNACSYLTEELASRVLQAPVKPSVANEHIPTIWSQCIYTGRGVRRRQIKYQWKFMPWEMFDVDNLHPIQLEFNVKFAASGQPPVDRLDDLGKASFVFDDRDRSVLLVITGIRGPDNAAQSPTALIATYTLLYEGLPHDARIAVLLEQARLHLREWYGR